MTSTASRFAAAQTNTELVAAPASGNSIHVRIVHLSVPDGQNAQLKAGSGGSVIFSTESNANLDMRKSPLVVGDNTSLVIDSSGAASVFIEHVTKRI